MCTMTSRREFVPAVRVAVVVAAPHAKVGGLRDELLGKSDREMTDEPKQRQVRRRSGPGGFLRQ
jgi:hypothetical protein